MLDNDGVAVREHEFVAEVEASRELDEECLAAVADVDDAIRLHGG